jgi:hypothetical protein
MDEGYPAFENAVSQFHEFLAGQRWPPRVFWIRPGDARFRRGRIVIRPVSAEVGEAHAREVYARATSTRLGVMLEAVCRVNERTFARVVRPLDEDASSRGLFPDDLKLAALESPLSATIASGWMWPWCATASSWPFNDPDIEA